MKLTIGDFDGTVSEHAANPAEAVAHPGFWRFVDPYLRQGDEFFFLTGRDPRFIFFTMPQQFHGEITIVGNHGMTRVSRTGELEIVDKYKIFLEATAELERALGEQITQTDSSGLSIIENKTLGLILHLRRLDRSQAIEVVQAAKGIVLSNRELSEHFVIESGDAVLELRPNVDHNKGHAVLEIFEGFEGAVDSISFAGDDIPDIPAFDTAKAIRREHGVGGKNFYVMREGGALEQEDLILDSSDVLVATTEELIDRLASELLVKPLGLLD